MLCCAGDLNALTVKSHDPLHAMIAQNRHGKDPINGFHCTVWFASMSICVVRSAVRDDLTC